MTPLVLAIPALALAATALVAWAVSQGSRGVRERLAKHAAPQPLAQELPFWAFFDEGDLGVAVSVDGSLSATLALRGIDTDCLDGEALSQISRALHGILLGVPAGVVLQFFHATDGNVSETVSCYRRLASPRSPLGSVLIHEKADDVERRGGLRRSRLHLTIGLSPELSAGLGGLRGLGRRTSFSPATHADATKRLLLVVDQVTKGLAAAGLEVDPLSAAALRKHIYQRLNPSRALTVPEPPTEGLDQTAREQLVFSDLAESEKALGLDDKLHRVLTLKALPGWTEPALLEALLVSLPFHAEVQVAIEALDPQAALDDLKRRRDRAHLLATLREKRNQEAEAQEDDVAELIDKNLRSSVRMVRLAVSVVLSVDGNLPDASAVLERQTQEVLRVASSLHGIQLMVDGHAQLDELLATLPGNARRGRRWRRLTSENAAHMSLAWQPWAGSPSPRILLENGRGNLLGLDPFDDRLDNPNAFMAGVSGSGKSATTNYLLLNLLATGARALIVDVGGSYRRILDVFGGDYFALGLDRGAGADHALNPFFSPGDIVVAQGKAGPVLDERRLQLLLAVLERMVIDSRRPELSNAERAVLAAAIASTYDGPGDSAPILSDLVATLRATADLGEDPEEAAMARGLARDLRIWTEGPAARLVNRPTTVSLTTDLAAFDLKGLETNPQLQAVVLLILSGILWNLVLRDPTAEKVIVFDEVWRLLESPASARLVAELYRTSRKYRCSILTISQSVEDFTSSPIATALTANSATVYLLKHRRGHDVVAGQFRLNARELTVFQGLEMRRGEYTEALILHGEHHFLARVVLSPLEYWIATTHPADLALEARERAAHPQLSRIALLRRLAARHPRGAVPETSLPGKENP